MPSGFWSILYNVYIHIYIYTQTHLYTSDMNHYILYVYRITFPGGCNGQLNKRRRRLLLLRIKCETSWQWIAIIIKVECDGRHPTAIVLRRILYCTSDQIYATLLSFGPFFPKRILGFKSPSSLGFLTPWYIGDHFYVT